MPTETQDRVYKQLQRLPRDGLAAAKQLFWAELTGRRPEEIDRFPILDGQVGRTGRRHNAGQELLGERIVLDIDPIAAPLLALGPAPQVGERVADNCPDPAWEGDIGQVLCLNQTSGEQRQTPTGDLVEVRRCGEAIFPALTPMDRVQNGPNGTPWHTLIEADSYHALQLLEFPQHPTRGGRQTTPFSKNRRGSVPFPLPSNSPQFPQILGLSPI